MKGNHYIGRYLLRKWFFRITDYATKTKKKEHSIQSTWNLKTISYFVNFVVSSQKKEICGAKVTLVAVSTNERNQVIGIAPWNQIKEYARIFNKLQI